MCEQISSVHGSSVLTVINEKGTASKICLNFEKKNDIYLWSRNTEFNKYLQKARYHNRKQERVMQLGQNWFRNTTAITQICIFYLVDNLQNNHNHFNKTAIPPMEK